LPIKIEGERPSDLSTLWLFLLQQHSSAAFPAQIPPEPEKVEVFTLMDHLQAHRHPFRSKIASGPRPLYAGAALSSAGSLPMTIE